METYPVNVDKPPNMSPGPDQTSLDLFRQDGERFQCPSCDSNYSRKDNLKAHLKKCHGENDLKVYLSNDLEPKNLKSKDQESKDLESNKNQNEASTKQTEKVDLQEDQKMDQKSMTQESFLGYFNLVRKGTEHQINSAIVEKKTRKSGRLSNPYYDTTQFYETIYDKKTSPPEDKKKLQCPSCENKYSRKDYLENHIRKTHEEKVVNSEKDINSDTSIDTEPNEKEVTVVKTAKKSCIPCEKTYFSSRDLKRHEQSLVHLSKIKSMDKKDVKYQRDQNNQKDQKNDTIDDLTDFQCPYCDSYFTQKSSVKTHVRLKHEGMLEVTDFSRISFIDLKDQKDGKDIKNQNDSKLRRKTAGDFPCVPCGKLYGSSYDLNRHKDTSIHKTVIKHSKMDQKDQIKLKNSDIEEIKVTSSRRRTIGDCRLNNLVETRKSSKETRVNVKVFEQNVEPIVDLKNFDPHRDWKSIDHVKTAREVEESLNDPNLGTVVFKCNSKKCLLKVILYSFLNVGCTWELYI